MILSKREEYQCNHCQYAEWEYGTSYYSGWYVCSLKQYTESDDASCGCFKHFKGILIRKQWIE
jgi:hypothetical protein